MTVLLLILIPIGAYFAGFSLGRIHRRHLRGIPGPSGELPPPPSNFEPYTRGPMP